MFTKKNKTSDPENVKKDAGNAADTAVKDEESAAQAAEAEDVARNSKPEADAQAEAGGQKNGEGQREPADDGKSAEEIARLKDQMLRLQADFSNYRKRMAREHDEVVAQANQKLLKELLASIDNLDRSIDVMGKQMGTEDSCYVGVSMVRASLMASLAKFGVARMETAGKPFDPNLHEAVGTVPAPAGLKDGDIAFEARPGYTLNGKVLRAAQVLVASAPADAAEASADGEKAAEESASGDAEAEAESGVQAEEAK